MDSIVVSNGAHFGFESKNVVVLCNPSGASDLLGAKMSRWEHDVLCYKSSSSVYSRMAFAMTVDDDDDSDYDDDDDKDKVDRSARLVTFSFDVLTCEANQIIEFMQAAIALLLPAKKAQQLCERCDFAPQVRSAYNECRASLRT